MNKERRTKRWTTAVVCGASAIVLILASVHPVLFSQQLQHETGAINIEVPVRVMKGKTFVDDLSIDDFELLEEGRPQKIEAVYLVRKTDVRRSEGDRALNPRLSRCFVLLFEMVDYMPEIDRALELFFGNVIGPGDDLIVVTPLKTYHLLAEALAARPSEVLKEELKGKLRRDIIMGGREYVNIIKDMARYIAGDESAEALDRYLADLSRLEQIRYVDDKKLVEFSRFLKDRAGQKHVFLFYQKERIPKINPQRLTELLDYQAGNFSEVFRLMELFDFFRRDVSFNDKAVREAFSDSSIAVHFLYITKTPAQIMDIEAAGPTGLVLAEQSEDIYSAFRGIAEATGGISESSANPTAAFAEALEASENYYLLYYKPEVYKADGRFVKIDVRVESGKYAVTHRAGYVAD
jgi:hypothetical protein